MRKRCLETVYKIAKEDKSVIFIGSDLGKGTLDEFKEDFPDRFFMEGISEQHVVSMAAGLALEGKKVYVNTIATFITRRCFDQNVIDLGLAKSNVRLIGNGGGLVYAPLGPTHLAIEDISIMRSIPNMTVLVPSDADEMERAVKASQSYEGPIYFRVAKGGDPVISHPENGFEIGKGITYRPPGPVTIVSTGILTKRAAEVSDRLKAEGHEVGVVHLHTIKPLDTKLLKNIFDRSKAVLTIEENTTIGGLSSAVADLYTEWDGDPLILKRIALRDEFPEKYGSQNDILKHYDLDTESIYEKTKGLCAKVERKSL